MASNRVLLEADPIGLESNLRIVKVRRLSSVFFLIKKKIVKFVVLQNKQEENAEQILNSVINNGQRSLNKDGHVDYRVVVPQPGEFNTRQTIFKFQQTSIFPALPESYIS